MTQDTSTKYVKNTQHKMERVFLSMLENRNQSSKIPDFRHIELNTFLKIKGIADTGGKAKFIIRTGSVKVNGETETRNKRKLHAGDVVEYLGKAYEVNEDFIK